MYEIEFKPKAQKYIEGQPRNVQRKLIRKIEDLATNPHPKDSKRLDAKKQIYRLRYRAYRILYQIKKKNLVIIVAKVGPRKDVYKNLSKWIRGTFAIITV